MPVLPEGARVRVSKEADSVRIMLETAPSGDLDDGEAALAGVLGHAATVVRHDPALSQYEVCCRRRLVWVPDDAVRSIRRVRLTKDAAKLEAAMKEHGASWREDLARLCGQDGDLMWQKEGDWKGVVHFPLSRRPCSIPLECLEDAPEQSKGLRVGEAVGISAAGRSYARLVEVMPPGSVGEVLGFDEDGDPRVRVHGQQFVVGRDGVTSVPPPPLLCRGCKVEISVQGGYNERMLAFLPPGEQGVVMSFDSDGDPRVKNVKGQTVVVSQEYVEVAGPPSAGHPPVRSPRRSPAAAPARRPERNLHADPDFEADLGQLLQRCGHSGGVHDYEDAPAGEPKECAYCLEVLSDGVRAVGVPTKAGRRTCRHFFHELCLTDWLTSKRTDEEPTAACPFCDERFDAVRKLPHPLEDQDGWFALVDISGDGRLQMAEVLDGLSATCPVDERALEQQVGQAWPGWDPNDRGLGPEQLPFLMAFIKAYLPDDKIETSRTLLVSHVRRKPPPFTQAKLDAWFDYWDAGQKGHSTGRMHRNTLANALVRTVVRPSPAVPEGDAAAAERATRRQVMHVRQSLKDVWCVFDTKNTGTVSREDFCARGGLGESLIAAIVTDATAPAAGAKPAAAAPSGPAPRTKMHSGSHGSGGPRAAGAPRAARSPPKRSPAVQQLVDMGFAEDVAIAALVASDDHIPQAISSIIRGSKH